VEDARRALKQAVPQFDRYFADRSTEIVAARDWYLQAGTFDLNRVISGTKTHSTRRSRDYLHEQFIGLRILAFQ